MPRHYDFIGLECGLSFLILMYSQNENYQLSQVAYLKGTWILESQNWPIWSFSYKYHLWISIKPNEPLKQSCWKNKNYSYENWRHSILHVIGINKYYLLNPSYLPSLYPVPVKDRRSNKFPLFTICMVLLFFLYSSLVQRTFLGNMEDKDVDKHIILLFPLLHIWLAAFFRSLFKCYILWEAFPNCSSHPSLGWIPLHHTSMMLMMNLKNYCCISQGT